MLNSVVMPLDAAQLEKRILISVLLLLLFGHVMLFSATAIMGMQQYRNEFHFVIKQGIVALLGLALLLLFSRVRYQVWNKLAIFLMCLQVLLIASTLVGPLAHPAAGVSRWLSLGPIRFQPSEAAKITVAIYSAHVICLWQAKELTGGKLILYFLPVAVLLLCVFRQPDLGSTILLSAMMIGLFFLAGGKVVYVFSVVALGAAGFALSLLNSEYQHRRFVAFLNPWADPQGSGFQTIQSFVSIHAGKLFGVGLGNGNSKLFFLPEVHTDFIFSLVGEELGFVGSMGLIIAFLYFSHLIFRIVRYAPDKFGSFLAFGLSLSLIFQIAVNLGGVTGLIPVKGLPLPFISWGRSALIVNLAIVGILLNVARQSGKITPTKKKLSVG